MTKDAENKMSMYNAFGSALVKTKDKVGENFEKVYNETLKAELENRRHECQEKLTETVKGILRELSLIRVLNDELESIEKRLQAQEE